MKNIEELAGIAIDGGLKIHMDLGPGLLESFYKAALAATLMRRGLAIEMQRPISVEYEGLILDGFRADILIENTLIIEIKSVERMATPDLSSIDEAAPWPADEFRLRYFSGGSEAGGQQSSLRVFA